MAKKDPVRLEIYRSFDPVIRRYLTPAAGAKYAMFREVDLLREAGLPKEAKPTLFVCHALKRSQRERLDLLGSQRQQFRAAFAMALMEIRDIADEHGRPTNPATWRARRERAGASLDEDALDELEELGFGDTDIFDIGAAIVGMSSVGKGRRASCVVPGSSHLAWNIPKSSRPAEPRKGDETPPEK